MLTAVAAIAAGKSGMRRPPYIVRSIIKLIKLLNASTVRLYTKGFDLRYTARKSLRWDFDVCQGCHVLQLHAGIWRAAEHLVHTARLNRRRGIQTWSHPPNAVKTVRSMQQCMLDQGWTARPGRHAVTCLWFLNISSFQLPSFRTTSMHQSTS